MSSYITFALRHARLGLIAAGLCSSAAFATPFATIGSAGSIDTATAGSVGTVSGSMTLAASAPIGTALVRYPVAALKGFAGSNKTATLRVRYGDAGAAERLVIVLRQYGSDGTFTTLTSFDSDDFASSATFQTQQICFPVDAWDFKNGPFYLEASLIKTGAGGTPALANMVLTPDSCTP
jgi:hypothetical protein